jgi:predicted Rossmann fold nucleotide-binding protein DprA/Smf involved in DNA uptake
MTVSPNTQAVLLLTAHFSKSSGDSAKPLTPKEWGRFAVWLKDHALTPEQLMTSHPKDLLEGWSDRQITLDRLDGLLNRGSALAIAMEKWLRAGLWVMTRSDTDYPSRLKKRLGTDSPAVFYGCGNRSLLNSGGLAVVGSRNAADDDLQYTRQLGAAAANQGHTVVSGGARGVDEAAMLGALESEGTAIGILADSLLRACSSSKYRRHLLAKNLVLISTFHPEAGFNAGNAMQRNKYIYCLSDAALVVHSGAKGGTWSGATENLKKRWVPLWVKPTGDAAAGNEGLAKQGGRWVAENVRDVIISDLFLEQAAPSSAKADLLPLVESSVESPTEDPVRQEGTPSSPPKSVMQEAEPPEPAPVCTRESPTASGAETSAPAVDTNAVSPDTPSASEAPKSDMDLTFYTFFLRKLSIACASSAKTPDELGELFELNKTQVNTWLKRALSEKRLRKLSKPVRYEWIDTQQASLFDS